MIPSLAGEICHFSTSKTKHFLLSVGPAHSGASTAKNIRTSTQPDPARSNTDKIRSLIILIVPYNHCKTHQIQATSATTIHLLGVENAFTLCDHVTLKGLVSVLVLPGMCLELEIQKVDTKSSQALLCEPLYHFEQKSSSGLGISWEIFAFLNSPPQVTNITVM
jgi:hypothetical protein